MRESFPDPSQFEKSSKYYDGGATEESPRWFCVDVKLMRALATPIPLALLKQHKEGALKEMALFRMSRLSVQPVTREQWDFVLGLEEKE